MRAILAAALASFQSRRLSMPDARLRVALVGAGLVGQAEHAFYLWEERERFQLAAVVDASRTVREGVAERYGTARTAASLDELDAAQLDAVVVCVPDGLHRDVVVDA